MIREFIDARSDIGLSKTPSRYRNKVEPSNRVESGIFVTTNEHYQLKQNDPPKMLMMALREHWNEAMEAATRIAAHLLQLT